MRKIYSIVLTFFLSAALASMAASAFFGWGWSSEKRLVRLVSSSGYAYEMTEYAKEEIISYLEEKSIPKTVIEKIWDEEKNYRSLVDQKEPDVKTFEKDLQKAVYEDLESNEVVVTNAMSKDIEQTVQDVTDIYERCLSPSFFEMFHQYMQTVKMWCCKVLLLSIVIALVCSILLWKSYHYKHHAMQYMAVSALTAALWNLAGLIWLGMGEWITKAGIEPEAYRNLLEEFHHGGIQLGIGIVGIEILIFGILCMRIKIRKKV